MPHGTAKKKKRSLLNLLTSCFALSGRVSWDEYKVKFLASKGHDEREVADKIKNKWDLNVDEESKGSASRGQCGACGSTDAEREVGEVGVAAAGRSCGAVWQSPQDPPGAVGG